MATSVPILFRYLKQSATVFAGEYTLTMRLLNLCLSIPYSKAAFENRHIRTGGRSPGEDDLWHRWQSTLRREAELSVHETEGLIADRRLPLEFVCKLRELFGFDQPLLPSGCKLLYSVSQEILMVELVEIDSRCTNSL